MFWYSVLFSSFCTGQNMYFCRSKNLLVNSYAFFTFLNVISRVCFKRPQFFFTENFQEVFLKNYKPHFVCVPSNCKILTKHSYYCRNWTQQHFLPRPVVNAKLWLLPRWQKVRNCYYMQYLRKQYRKKTIFELFSSTF